MALAVYSLCALTSIACALLLFRQFRRTSGRLLLWSTACFFCLAVSNILLFADRVLFPSIDLSDLRSVFALMGMMMLLYGLIMETT
jgi:hypothetical protein